MKIKSVAEVLKKHGLAAPELEALRPDRTNYKLCLLQPKGDITYDATGLRHTNAALAATEFAAFIDEAIARRADLAVTPEYAMPWDVLIDALADDKTPKPGKLWALGCESITFEALEALRDDANAVAHFIFEDLSEVEGQFVDPLAYVFWAPRKNNAQQLELVVLVQFKTEPMSDPQQFEVNHLRKGNRIYQFGEHGKSVRLTSFICSDALKVDDAIAAQLYQQSLILHIQLNPDPRHKLFRAYRDKLMSLSDGAPELICLNWASGVTMSAGATPSVWNSPANSAWYLKPDQFDRNDGPLADNHRKGLYYTYESGHRVHALFFNYAPALFILEATKAAHIAQPAIAKRTGPNLKEMLNWNGAAWTQGAAADGFASVIAHAGPAQTQVQNASTSNPFWAERLLALSAGSITNAEDWYCVKQLDSCAINQDEFIKRITFCQDPEPTSAAFRTGRLKLCGHLVTTVQTVKLPPSLTDLGAGYDLKWAPASPHQNAFTASGAATIIYMGETATESQMQKTRDLLDDFLRRSIKDDQKSILARQRLAIWYRDATGQVQLYEQRKLLDIDDPKTSSSLDLAREK